LTELISRREVLQVDFLFDVYEDVVKEEPLSFLEVGCGPAQHSMEMAESQLAVYCVDNSTEMLDYAAALAAEDDIVLNRVHADMRNFSLPVRPP
jgi:SAM-dependent methyltransferase